MKHVYVVTGATSGIGAATATALAEPGVTVAIIARDRSRGEAAAARIRRDRPDSTVDVFVADLAVLDAVRDVATEIAERYERVDALVNNAGVAFSSGTTPDGADPIFTTNHLAPFLLTHVLGARLAASPGGRVVTVASSTHRQVKRLDWATLGTIGAPHRYAVSKLANVLFTRALARRLAGTSVTANAADPGFVRTGLGRGASGPFKVFLALVGPFQASAARGAESSIFLTRDPSVAGQSGGYYVGRTLTEPGALARDDEAGERLWQLSAERCGIG
jgi:retinol dehydrogenase-12